MSVRTSSRSLTWILLKWKTNLQEIKFMDLFFKLFDFTESIKNRTISRIMSLLVRTMANIYAPFYYRCSRIDGVRHKLEKPLIVSFTSFPRRIGKVWLVVESLLHQSVLPDKILLYLSKEQFPDELNSLPDNLLSLQDNLFEIKFVEGDLRSYKKFIYAFQEYPDAYIVTVDDDVFYPKDMISSLVEAHKAHEDCVIARYAHRMTYNEEGGGTSL